MQEGLYFSWHNEELKKPNETDGRLETHANGKQAYLWFQTLQITGVRASQVTCYALGAKE